MPKSPEQMPYQPSEEEIKKAEEMMTEEQKNRSVEREATIEAAGGKLEDKNLKTKIEQLNKVIMNQLRELHGKEGYEIVIILKDDKSRVGIGMYIDEKNCFRLENPRTHITYSIPIESIQCIEKAGKATWDMSERDIILWQE